MKWSGAKVVVTGAGGFIGSHLCELLVREGSRVDGIRQIHLTRRLGVVGPGGT